VKIGVNLINFGPGANPEALSSWARLVEELGFHLLMTSDHVAITDDVASRYPAPFYEPLTVLGWLAGATRRLELGTTVIIVPYRHPLETARATAVVDQLCGGRFIFGIGVGWAKQEFETLGLPFEKRGAMTDDYLGAIKTCWTQDVASYEGRFVRFAGVHTTPRPLQTPHPPIWVGGASEAAMRRAVLHGDAWHPIRARIDWLRDTGLPRLREIAAKENRPVPALCPRIKLHLSDGALPDEQRVAGQGSLEQVRADLRALEAMGAPYVLLDTYSDDPEATRSHEPAWRLLKTAANRLVDLARGTIRS
jgi:probable F420-dependent oxidoreductase